MEENIIYDPCSVHSYPLLSDQMAFVKAMSFGGVGIIKGKRIPDTFKCLQDIAKEALVIVDYIKSHETTYHKNYRFTITSTDSGEFALDIVLVRMPHGSKKSQQLKVNVGYMHNPHWRVVFDSQRRLVSCGSFSNSSMSSRQFNQFDDVCIQKRTYHKVLSVFKEITAGLSDEPVEIEMTQKYLNDVKRREEKKAALREKIKLANRRKREKEKEKREKKIQREREKYLGLRSPKKIERKYTLRKTDGTIVQVTEKEYYDYQTKLKRILEMEKRLK